MKGSLRHSWFRLHTSASAMSSSGTRASVRLTACANSGRNSVAGALAAAARDWAASRRSDEIRRSALEICARSRWSVGVGREVAPRAEGEGACDPLFRARRMQAGSSRPPSQIRQTLAARAHTNNTGDGRKHTHAHTRTCATHASSPTHAKQRASRIELNGTSQKTMRCAYWLGKSERHEHWNTIGIASSAIFLRYACALGSGCGRAATHAKNSRLNPVTRSMIIYQSHRIPSDPAGPSTSHAGTESKSAGIAMVGSEVAMTVSWRGAGQVRPWTLRSGFPFGGSDRGG